MEARRTDASVDRVTSAGAANLEATAASNKQLQKATAARLAELDARLQFLTCTRHALVNGDGQRRVVPAVGSTGVKRPRRNTNTLALISGYASEEGLKHKVQGDEKRSVSASPSVDVGHALRGYPTRPLIMSTRTILRANGTCGDPFRFAGAVAHASQRVIQYVPVPRTTDAVREGQLAVVFPTDWWVVRGLARWAYSRRRRSTGCHRAPTAARGNALTKRLLSALGNRQRKDLFVLRDDGVDVSSLPVAVANAAELVGQLDDVVSMHWPDLVHLRHHVFEALLRRCQVHYPRRAWSERFWELLNLPLRSGTTSGDEERRRFVCLITCRERDFVETAARVAELLCLRTVHTFLHRVRPRTDVMGVMAALLSQCEAEGTLSVPFLGEKCARLVHAVTSTSLV